MKSIITLIVTACFFMMNPAINYGQCTPGDETTCPDPENNGEVCPAVLPNGIIGKEYSQEFTIIAPPAYEWNDQTIPLHHLKIVDVANLPPGMTWQTNATDSVFMAGTYYCVLLSGTSQETGTFPLKIVVDVYLNFLGNPIYATQVVDSTSISLKITWDPDGIESYTKNDLAIRVFPNPFQQHIFFEIPEKNNDPIVAEIYSILGNSLIRKNFSTSTLNNKYSIDCSHLMQGTYLLKVNSGTRQATKLIRKTR